MAAPRRCQQASLRIGLGQDRRAGEQDTVLAGRICGEVAKWQAELCAHQISEIVPVAGVTLVDAVDELYPESATTSASLTGVSLLVYQVESNAGRPPPGVSAHLLGEGVG